MTYIPPQALADAKCVIAAQDPEVSVLERNWPAKTWQAAIKQAGEQHVVDIDDGCVRDDMPGRICVGAGLVQGKQGELW